MPLYVSIPFTLTASASSVPPYPGGSLVPPPLSFAWRQVRGPARAILTGAQSHRVEITVPRAGSYHFECAVNDGAITNRVQRSVQVDSFWSAQASYTAFCPLGSGGASVTRSARATSILSAADAQARAQASALQAAQAALRCDPLPGPGGWRIKVPPLPVGSSLRLTLGRLNQGTALRPKRIDSVAVLDFGPESLPPFNLIDLSAYLSGGRIDQTLYLWVRVRLAGSGQHEFLSGALKLTYATPEVALARVRFRDVETPYTSYQGYSSAYALSLNQNVSVAIGMSLDLGNGWPVLSLATHGWDGKAYGLAPQQNYDRLILTLLEGSPQTPKRETVLLAAPLPAYSLADPYDFARNRFELGPYLAGASSGPLNYILRRGRARADGSFEYDSADPGLRFESAPGGDYTAPGLNSGPLTLSSLSANEAGSIVPGPNIALSLKNLEATPALVSFPLPRWSLSSFKWKTLTDPYSYVLVIVLKGTPGGPEGIGNRYAFALGDPEVLDGPDNLFLPLAEFGTVKPGPYPARFEPFTAVFYAATLDPQSENYTLYPNSFPVLANPRTVHGEATYSISDFPGFGSYPSSERGAVTFSGVFAYAETIYHARVNGGNPFPV